MAKSTVEVHMSECAQAPKALKQTCFLFSLPFCTLKGIVHVDTDQRDTGTDTHRICNDL